MKSPFLNRAKAVALLFGSILLFGAEAKGQEDDDDQWSPFVENGESGVRIPKILAPDPAETPLLDKIWSYPRLIDNPDNPFFQELRIVGRYHGQYGNVSSSQGKYDGYETRRRRLGLVTTFLNQFRVRVQVKGEGEQSLFENDNVEDAWIAWRPTFFPELTIKAGQFKPLWSYEWGLSSNTMPVVERSQFVNQFKPDRSTGISAALELGQWSVGLAGFSGNLEDGFLDGHGGFGILNLGYDFAEQSEVWDDLDWRFDYLYNDDSGQISSNQAYRNAYSTSIEGKSGNLGLAVELMYIDGLGNAGDAFGATLMPTYELIPDKLFLAGRYHYSNADSADRLFVQSRFEGNVPGIGDGAGKRYHSAYVGLNWFLYKKILFMNGVEYSNMAGGGSNGGDFDGWTFFSGFRIWF